MAKKPYDTPNLDALESGPWPSFVTGLKRLAKDKDSVVDLLGHLEHSYATKKGYWKGGTLGVYGYGGGVIPRFTEIKDENGKPVFPEAAEFHTLRVMPPAGMHYSTDILRKLADIWERNGSGLIAFHGQSGDIMFQGATSENVQKAFDEINEAGFDLGGAGPALRTSMSCVGAARCEQSCYDEGKAHRMVINSFLDDIHRPALPYKFKFKFSGCPNDCMNSIQRSDLAVIGTWRDNIRTDEALAKKWFAKHGMNELVNDVVAHCPTSNARLGAGAAPVPAMLAAGVPVGLGVDGAASNEEGSMAAELHAALLVARLRGGPAALTARQALAVATVGGARCLGRADELGSLEVGKLADVALWRVDALPHAGIDDPVAALVLGSRPPLRMLLVDGETVVEDDVLLTADEPALAADAARGARRLRDRAGR